ncbi:unnamed protein product [Parnassius apollo]|uniref:(apollo) hypothetical protein n=1 Tax=Parnassius apollo TaxID=110799 RepID=A0A8S3XM36_PARAO|nr:unnamed protein product [Parnassius apollo]
MRHCVKLYKIYAKERKAFDMLVENMQYRGQIENIVKKSNLKNPFKDGIPGQKWLKSFLKRHPEISLRVPENFSKDRVLVTEATIRNWFQNLRKYLTKINASDVLNDGNRIFNGDESGFSLCSQTGKFWLQGDIKMFMK